MFNSYDRKMVNKNSSKRDRPHVILVSNSQSRHKVQQLRSSSRSIYALTHWCGRKPTTMKVFKEMNAKKSHEKPYFSVTWDTSCNETKNVRALQLCAWGLKYRCGCHLIEITGKIKKINFKRLLVKTIWVHKEPGGSYMRSMVSQCDFFVLRATASFVITRGIVGGFSSQARYSRRIRFAETWEGVDYRHQNTSCINSGNNARIISIRSYWIVERMSPLRSVSQRRQLVIYVNISCPTSVQFVVIFASDGAVDY